MKGGDSSGLGHGHEEHFVGGESSKLVGPPFPCSAEASFPVWMCSHWPKAMTP